MRGHLLKCLTSKNLDKGKGLRVTRHLLSQSPLFDLILKKPRMPKQLFAISNNLYEGLILVFRLQFGVCVNTYKVYVVRFVKPNSNFVSSRAIIELGAQQGQFEFCSFLGFFFGIYS